MYILAQAPGGRMRGAATQALPLSTVEERQQSGCPPAAAPLRAAVRRHAGCVARSLHTRSMLVARALPACLGTAANCTCYFCADPEKGTALFSTLLR